MCTGKQPMPWSLYAIALRQTSFVDDQSFIRQFLSGLDATLNYRKFVSKQANTEAMD